MFVVVPCSWPFCCAAAAHVDPLPWYGDSTRRVWYWIAAPHVAVHCDHGLIFDTTQEPSLGTETQEPWALSYGFQKHLASALHASDDVYGQRL